MTVSYKDLERITQEVVLGVSPKKPDTKEQAKARRQLEKEKREADRKGQMLTFPTEPD